MARPRKYPEGTVCRFNVRVTRDVVAHIQELSSELGVTQSELVMLAVNAFVDNRVITSCKVVPIKGPRRVREL